MIPQTPQEPEAFGSEVLDLLEAVPDPLFEATVTCPLGALGDRVSGLLAWRSALLEGRVPEADVIWPGAEWHALFASLLGELELARYCEGSSEVTDEVLLGLVELARSGSTLSLSRERLVEPFVLPWRERVAGWRRLETLFGEMGKLLGTGHDLGRGALRATGLLAAERLHQLILRVPWFTQIVQTLSRVQASDRGRISQRLFEPMRLRDEPGRQARVPVVASDARGIERSGSVARMLPSEASLLGHPVLRRLWHARRAERTLLSYLLEGSDWGAGVIRPPPPAERGPVILVLDTSASMRGAPEIVGKALALEAARTAHAEGRRCLVLAFGSREEVVEHDLSLEEEGIRRLLDFLMLSFEGGTEMGTPLERVATLLESGRMARADVAVVTDGIFELPAEAAHRLRRVLEKTGGRLHGVLVGRESSPALERMCEGRLHRFQSWAELSGARS